MYFEEELYWQQFTKLNNIEKLPLKEQKEYYNRYLNNLSIQRMWSQIGAANGGNSTSIISILFGSKDTTFNIGTGFDDDVTSIAIQSDGKLLVGGWFTTFNGTSQNKLIRLNSDGSKDTTFDIGTGFNNNIESVIIQSDGKILVGGDFTTFNGTSQNGLIRLNSNGSKDTSLNIGTGFTSGGVYSIAVQSDGKILVGGGWITFNSSGVQRYFIRLNSDGSKDTSFVVGTGIFGGFVLSIAVQSDGKILVGGDFTTFAGATQRGLVRVNTNGSKDTSFDLGSGFIAGNIIETIAIQSDGKILVGGDLSSFNGSPLSNLIRLNSNGSQDTSLNIGTGFDFYVYSVIIQSDGKILVGGAFSEFNGTSQNGLIRLNSNGSKDTTFDIGTGTPNNIYSVAVQSDGKVLAGGYFTTFNDSPQNCLIRLM